MPNAATEYMIGQVVKACLSYGGSSIIALAGPPATGKSHVALIAAQRHAGLPSRVREIQFHQAFTYEEFMEGLRIDATGAVSPKSGVFLETNEDATHDPAHNYVLLIEELTRANIAAVLGELLTYVEHRERTFRTLFSGTSVQVAPRLTILATFNPVDRSALGIDDALLRRLRIIDFLPDTGQLEDMLATNAPGLPKPVVKRLKGIFETCQAKHPKEYETLVPFGHGIFSEVSSEADLYPLWSQRLRRMLYRPLQDPHPFAATIEAAYPWQTPNFKLALEELEAEDTNSSAPPVVASEEVAAVAESPVSSGPA